MWQVSNHCKKDNSCGEHKENEVWRESCPKGQTGYKIVKCVKGDVTVVSDHCKEDTSCGQHKNNEVWRESCPEGQTGYKIAKCVKGDVVVVSDHCRKDTSCGEHKNNELWRAPCPKGQRGYILMKCVKGDAVVKKNNCKKDTSCGKHRNHAVWREPCPEGQVGYRVMKCVEGEVVEIKNKCRVETAGAGAAAGSFGDAVAVSDCGTHGLGSTWSESCPRGGGDLLKRCEWSGRVTVVRSACITPRPVVFAAEVDPDAESSYGPTQPSSIAYTPREPTPEPREPTPQEPIGLTDSTGGGFREARHTRQPQPPPQEHPSMDTTTIDTEFAAADLQGATPPAKLGPQPSAHAQTPRDSPTEIVSMDLQSVTPPKVSPIPHHIPFHIPQPPPQPRSVVGGRSSADLQPRLQFNPASIGARHAGQARQAEQYGMMHDSTATAGGQVNAGRLAELEGRSVLRTRLAELEDVGFQGGDVPDSDVTIEDTFAYLSDSGLEFCETIIFSDAPAHVETCPNAGFALSPETCTAAVDIIDTMALGDDVPADTVRTVCCYPDNLLMEALALQSEEFGLGLNGFCEAYFRTDGKVAAAPPGQASAMVAAPTEARTVGERSEAGQAEISPSSASALVATILTILLVV